MKVSQMNGIKSPPQNADLQLKSFINGQGSFPDLACTEDDELHGGQLF